MESGRGLRTTAEQKLEVELERKQYVSPTMHYKEWQNAE